MNNEEFEKRNSEFVKNMAIDRRIKKLSAEWMNHVLEYEYHYHFSWLGMPMIQFPSDILVLQELVWRLEPDLIVDVGVARGGSVIFFASMLSLIGNEGHVVGVDIDFRAHNLKAIKEHKLYRNVTLIEGSSTDKDVKSQLISIANKANKVMVILDSNHSHEHVLMELETYTAFVTLDSYIVVFDTVIEEIPEKFNEGKPWSRGNSPKTAVDCFLEGNNKFILDRSFEEKALITSAPGGFLRRVKL